MLLLLLPWVLVLLLSSSCVSVSGSGESRYSFALFWPQPGAAADADAQFRNIFRASLQELCQANEIPLPDDFSVSFEEFYMPSSRPSYAQLNSYAERIGDASKKFLFAGITSASEEVRRLIKSTGDFQLHWVDPPPLSELAPSLLKVIKMVHLSANSTTTNPNDIEENRKLVVAVGPPYRLSDVQHLLKSIEYGVSCFAINSPDLTQLLLDIWNTEITTILVLANRTDTVRFLYGGIDSSLWSPDYRWILYDSALMFTVKPNTLPSNSRNITSVEFGPYYEDVAGYLRTLEQVMLHDLLAIWTAFMANLTCGVSMEVLQVRGLTGQFSLWANGTLSRWDWQMAIYRNLLTHAAMVGNFSTLGRFNLSAPQARSNARQDILDQYQKLNLTVLVLPGSPYARYKQGMANRTDIPLRYRLEGLAYDLCMEVLANLGLSNLTVVVQQDRNYGSQVRGQWNGVIKTLIEGAADIACVDLSPTSARKEVADFTAPFLTTNVSILYKAKLTDSNKEMFQFLFPFDSGTWFYLFGGMLLVATVLAVLHRISPNRQPFDLRYGLFFSFASLVQGIVGQPPSRPSGRMVVTAYWLFVTLMLVAYVSNYAAMRTLARLDVDISTVSSLLDQTSYTYGTLANSSLSASLQNSTFSDIKLVYDRMRQFRAGLFSDPLVAIEAVKQGNYAMIYDTPNNEYAQQLLCHSVVTGHFDSVDLAFGLPRRSDLKPLMDEELKKLLTKGRALELYRKYFTLPASSLPDCSSHTLASLLPDEPDALAPEPGALTLRNTFGLLIINIVGCCVTLIMAGVEFACRRLRRAKLQKRTTEKLADLRRPNRRKSLANILRLDSSA